MNIIPAHYTEVLINLLNNPKAKQEIDVAMSSYPLYQSKSKEEYIPTYIPTRQELNNKILNYYKYREIGFETFGRFLDELETALLEIMPRYNQLYFSADQDFNVTYNVDYKRTIDRNKENTNNTESTSTVTSQASDSTNTSASVNTYSKNINSKTPQGDLDITAQNINNVSYADEINWNQNQSTDTANSSGTTSTSGSNTGNVSGNDTEEESTVETTKGNFGVVSAQDLILKYRETILNIDQMIINDPRIQELFMLVY